MHVITANRLDDGEVVWLATGNGWVETLEGARIFETAETLAAGLEQGAGAAAAQIVVDVYACAVERVDGRIVPTRFRERIRALGPTVRRDLGKQSRATQTAA